MKRKLLIIGAIVVVLLVVLAVALPLLVNVDSFRPTIEAQASNALGRKVEIGHMQLSLMAGGVKADDVSIADDPAFSRTPFLKAKSLEVGVDLLPLILSRSLNVRSFTLVEPEVSLLHSASGKWNFSTLGAKKSAAAGGGGAAVAGAHAPSNMLAPIRSDSTAIKRFIFVLLFLSSMVYFRPRSLPVPSANDGLP